MGFNQKFSGIKRFLHCLPLIRRATAEECIGAKTLNDILRSVLCRLMKDNILFVYEIAIHLKVRPDSSEMRTDFVLKTNAIAVNKSNTSVTERPFQTKIGIIFANNSLS